MYVIATTFLLVAGFIALTVVETRRGARVFEKQRASLDRVATQGLYIALHVDFSSFAREQVRVWGSRIGHDLARWSLEGVRSVERFLTKLVRHLRLAQQIETVPQETSRVFVRTLSEFKGQLEASRPMRESEI